MPTTKLVRRYASPQNDERKRKQVSVESVHLREVTESWRHVHGLHLTRRSYAIEKHFDLEVAHEPRKAEFSLMPSPTQGNAYTVMYSKGASSPEISFDDMINFLKQADHAFGYVFYVRDKDGVLLAWYTHFVDESIAAPTAEWGKWSFENPFPTSVGYLPPADR